MASSEPRAGSVPGSAELLSAARDGVLDAGEWSQLRPWIRSLPEAASAEGDALVRAYFATDMPEAQRLEAASLIKKRLGYPVPSPLSPQRATERRQAVDRALRGNVTRVDSKLEALARRFGRHANQVTIAVIDDGFDTEVPALRGRNAGGAFAHAPRAHGTHVAAIAVAGTPNIKTHFIKADFVDRSAQDFEAAIATGARLINYSIAAQGDTAASIARVLARHPEVLVIAGAGNDGYPGVPGIVDDSPASLAQVHASRLVRMDLPNVIDVANARADGSLNPESAFGPLHVEIAAPGTDVLSAIPRHRIRQESYELQIGTSQAAPRVTNALAKALIMNPGLTRAELVRLLAAAADRQPYWSDKVGVGGTLNERRTYQLALLIDLVRAGGRPPAAAAAITTDRAERAALLEALQLFESTAAKEPASASMSMMREVKLPNAGGFSAGGAHLRRDR